MKKIVLGYLALLAVVLWAATGVGQPPEGRGKGQKKGGPPRFQLGKVLPPFARDELDLTPEQEESIRQLEKEVRVRLERILTPAQKQKLQDLRPRGPGGPGGPGGEGGDRRPPQGGRNGKRPSSDQPPEDRVRALDGEGIQWFATWESGLREARRSGRPILLVSAAPHCAGVSGTW